ncbi:MAG: DUF1365 domain-containing protein [bacterium]
MKPDIDTETACLYRAQVMHQRFKTVDYHFHYRIFSLLLDIDTIPEVAAASRLFSFNRFNLLSFHASDHLPAGETDLRAWANGVLDRAGIDGDRLRIRLLCFPRVLGWVFNPLSLWYCETPEGRPAAVIAEVRNTFGERHSYLLKPSAEHEGWPLLQRHRKDFHVSPFIGMQAEYAFRLPRPDERLSVLIREFEGEELMLVASQTGVRKPFTDWELLRQAASVPLQTLKVLAAIHWQALKIWLKGGQFHHKPPPPTEEIS